MKIIIRKKIYLTTLLFILFLLHYSPILISCPTCIGYPEKNKRPFFEEQTETTKKQANNETNTDNITTASKTIDNKEEKS
jgi:hypothetical protein